jgi:rare lipoprotein A
MSKVQLLKYLVFIFLLSCTKHDLHTQLSKHDTTNTKYQGHYKIGKPYVINDVKYDPSEVRNKNYHEYGRASWYGDKEHGNKTANGDKFNRYLLTAAHPKLPMPSIVKVTNLTNGKALIVMINDRGPFSKNRILDVSEAVAHRLNFKHRGTAQVKLEYLHHETQKFLTKLDLAKKEGSKAKKQLAVGKNCSVNCYLELLNAKHNLVSLSDAQKKQYQQSIAINDI